jgi:hypothetical protein
MAKHVWIVAAVVAVSLSLPAPAISQTESPETLAAAKELMVAGKMTENIKLMLPAILQQLKPLIARGNPLVERDFEVLIPVMQLAMESNLQDFMDEGAKIYARHFTVEEMRQVANFYRTPAGAKFIQQQPEVAKESMAMGQRWGQSVGEQVQKRMIEELRKRGHSI